MSMPSHQAASKAYAAIDLETSINSASPHKLILMLYEGAVAALYKARVFMQEKKVAQKGQEISHAIGIIDTGLASCLNQELGGEIAQNLASLYDYMSRRLLEANIHNNVEYINEVIGLLNELKGAWEQIGSVVGNAPASTATAAADTGLALESMPSSVINNGTGAEVPTSVSYGKA